MPGTLSNCTNCKKVFEKRARELCPACINLEEEQFQALYRRLQKSSSNGGIDIVQLSGELDIPPEAIEKIYRDGRLGTAGIFLKYSCIDCGIMMAERERKGRYCNTCSEKTSTAAGVEVRSIQEIKREEEAERIRQEYLEKPRTEGGRAARQFGRTNRIGI